MKKYDEFLRRKGQWVGDNGFKPTYLPSFLIDFQEALVEWTTLKGRAAVYADCGLGKTLIELVWAENVVRRTNKPVLIVAPLAVAAQTVREAAKFGIECERSHDGRPRKNITITNYEQLAKFDPNEFVGLACDESQILKNFDGVRRGEITQFSKHLPYRLLATATAAPNDTTELGTSSEALGHLGHIDMLNRFFVNDQKNTATKRMYGESTRWRFKGHAEIPFWRWVTTWARMIRKPSDLGFDDRAFILPELEQCEHLVTAARPPEGMLFSLPATDLRGQQEEAKRTIRERCERVAELVADTGEPALVACHLNPEGNLLERLIPGAVQVSGKDRNELKEERLLAFADKQIRVLVTKPSIAGLGMNFQQCAHVTYFPTHSYEDFYQLIRRCWRFGQTRPVRLDIVLTEGERKVMENLQRKAAAADEMFDRLVAEMNRSMSITRKNHFTKQEEIPAWL